MSLNEFLAPVSLPLSQRLGLPRLPGHFSTVLLSFLAFHTIQWTSPLVFSKCFPETYGKAPRRVRQGWAVRTCSMVNALIVVPLAFRCLSLPELDHDKVWGAHPREGELEAIACGFLWDAIEEGIIHFHDVGFALHGITALFALSLTFRPLFAYTSVRFLLMEITPLLNIHWFLDKTGRTGTRFQLANGAVLLAVFFFARICYGSITAFRFFSTLYEARAAVPKTLGIIYAVGTTGLQLLNWFWMYKMLGALRKRFPKAEDTVKKGR